MNILTWFKRKITGRHQSLGREQAKRITQMPKDQARRELGSILFAIGVERATEFVKDELRRTDRPFKGVAPDALFHEMLAVSFWIMDTEMAGGRKTLIPELHERYFRSYRTFAGSPEERGRVLMERYRQYAMEWDDHTGHQDDFGLCVAQNIFGTEPSERTRERTFWIIRYAHDLADDITPLKRLYRKKFSPESSGTAGER